MSDEFRFPEDEILTDRLRLRKAALEDAEDIAAALNDPAAREFLTSIADPYTLDDAKEWIERRARKAWEEGRAQWAIVDKDTGRFLGSIGLPTVMAARGHAEVGYWVAPWARGKGIATEAVEAVCDWLFAQDFTRVVLIADQRNIGSQRVALASGFRWEAILRGEATTRDGERVDTVQFARLSDDPKGRAERAMPDLAGGELTDGVVRLRPLGPEDSQDMYKATQVPEIARSMINDTEWTLEQSQRYADKAYSHWLAGQNARLTIRDAETDAYAGEIGLHFHGAPSMKMGMIGYSLIPAFQGRGFATRAVRLVCRWGFEELGLLRMEAGTAVWNEASQAVLRRAGFTREGVSRSYLPVPRTGKRDDNVKWGLLPGEIT